MGVIRTLVAFIGRLRGAPGLLRWYVYLARFGGAP